jgi:hypothetical protein
MVVGIWIVFKFNLVHVLSIRGSTSQILTERVLVGYEILTTVTRKSTIFWNVMPCSPVEQYMFYMQ